MVCFQLWFPKGQSSLLFTEGPHEQSPRRANVENTDGLRSERETPLLSAEFFPISTHTDFSKTCFSEARTQKARCTTRPRSPGLEHVRIIYMPEFYVFNVSMKHRQCEREPGPDMLSVNATSAVVPFCMLCKTKHRSKQKVMCVYQKKLTVYHSSTFRCTF